MSTMIAGVANACTRRPHSLEANGNLAGVLSALDVFRLKRLRNVHHLECT